jgi:FkbM family methyltransferase
VGGEQNDTEVTAFVMQRFHGQFGEDRILADMFPGAGPWTCVDVGANDGVTGSVSLYFEQAGWSCVLVEPNPELCARLRRERTSFVFEGAASSVHGVATLMLAEGAELSHAVSSIEQGAQTSIERQGLSVRAVDVRTAPLDTILEEAGAKPGEIAFVSIDVEGHELAVLKGFTLSRWRPRILVIEDNSLLFGNGVRHALASEGYVRFRRTGVNDWYAARSDREMLGSSPERDYIASMIRARGLMLRRRISRLLISAPVVGAPLGRKIRAARERRND